MAVIDSAVDGLAAAVISGLTALVSIGWTRRSRRNQLEDAWKKQADELAERLSRQYEGQIGYLRGEIDRRDAVIARKDDEIRRINVELNRQRRRGGAHD